MTIADVTWWIYHVIKSSIEDLIFLSDFLLSLLSDPLSCSFSFYFIHSLLRHYWGWNCLPIRSIRVHPCFSGVAKSLVFCVVFCRSLSFRHYSFGHCIVCPSIYDFWLPLSYLQTCFVCFVFNVFFPSFWPFHFSFLLRFTDYDYPLRYLQTFIGNLY